MSEYDYIKITGEHPSHRAGTLLRVLGPDDAIEPGTVDRVKAESLVEEHRLAEWSQEPATPEVEPPTPTRGRRRARHEPGAPVLDAVLLSDTPEVAITPLVTELEVEDE